MSKGNLRDGNVPWMSGIWNVQVMSGRRKWLRGMSGIGSVQKNEREGNVLHLTTYPTEAARVMVQVGWRRQRPESVQTRFLTSSTVSSRRSAAHRWVLIPARIYGLDRPSPQLPPPLSQRNKDIIARRSLRRRWYMYTLSRFY